MREQNKSHAVMSQRYEPDNSLDDFPTPPWATRALFEHAMRFSPCRWPNSTIWEPACGRGDMSKVLKEYSNNVHETDIHDYGVGATGIDFLQTEQFHGSDWIITNPPFNKAEEFALHAIPNARCGVALLVRTQFLESRKRYENLFSVKNPSLVAQFVERVPMVKGRLDKRASTATSYCWVIWLRHRFGETTLRWIPPCRKELEQEADYGDG